MDKVRENRLRRMATRQGLRLLKSHRRDPRAYDYQQYALIDERTNGLVTPVCAGLDTHTSGALYGATLDEVEGILRGEG